MGEGEWGREGGREGEGIWCVYSMHVYVNPGAQASVSIEWWEKRVK